MPADLTRATRARSNIARSSGRSGHSTLTRTAMRPADVTLLRGLSLFLLCSSQPTSMEARMDALALIALLQKPLPTQFAHAGAVDRYYQVHARSNWRLHMLALVSAVAFDGLLIILVNVSPTLPTDVPASQLLSDVSGPLP